MARVIWSLRAIEQLETLVEYIASYSPLEPRRFAQKSLIAPTSLASIPNRVGSFLKIQNAAIGRFFRGDIA